MKQTVIAFFLASMLIAVLPASAKHDKGVPGEGPKIKHRGMDTNGDGVITRNEWRGNDRSFAVHDWNGDGRLSGDELRPGAHRPDSPSQQEETVLANDGIITRFVAKVREEILKFWNWLF